MAGWFDEFAKRSARGKAPLASVADDTSGLSRRDVIARGALVAGAAWTAPMLMSTRAYAFGASTCSANKVCGGPAEQQFCCEFPVTGAGDANYQCTGNGTTVPYNCAPPKSPGGICVGNNGSGTSSCNTGVFCNGNANSGDCACTRPNTCGGYGSTCTSDAAKSCAPAFTCSGGFCRPSCSQDTDCPQTLLISGSFVCRSNVCRQTCSTKGPGTCPNGQNCVADAPLGTTGVCV